MSSPSTSSRYAWWLLAFLTLLLGASLGGPLVPFLAESLLSAGFAQPLTGGIFVAGQIGLLAIPLLLLATRRFSSVLT